MKSKVSEERLKAFITGNLLGFLAGEVSDKYFIDFLKILVKKDYMNSCPRFTSLLPKFHELLVIMQSKDTDRDEATGKIDYILDKLVK